ncbi:hypothetical protein FA10DRAFT_266903 [Acaromyces ingoldii]|uniref:Uncharacterized protein n=1 Tax=Acaromyces ingoldii TaxID=215250 RepID=A0A316YNP0_9BASI|nr:hypothetical protein FA10DRAFT_266903 [Acaromyces ingoldii]PWN90424.1 hypothetical protein FA10DRAFT_266903 [Acaromyces ingoldii]
MQRPVSSTSSTSSYAGGDDRYTRRPLTASSDSSSSVYHNAATSLSALTPTAATIGIGAASPSIASQHGQHHQQDFYGGVDASRRLSCPGDVSAMGSNIEHTSPIQQQHPADLARQQHQQPHSDEYATHQAGSHSYWR